MSKKAKTNAPIGEVEPERALEDISRNTDVMDDSAPQGENTEANPSEADPATHIDPSSPHATPPSPATDALSPTTNPPSLARGTVNPPSPPRGDDDDVVITGTAHTSPGNPVVLAKHTAKEEFIAMGKGKGKTDLSNFINLSAEELHSGFLNRLYTSRDFEAGLVNLMKERYEVLFMNTFEKLLYFVYLFHCSSQGSGYLLKKNRDFDIKNTSAE